MRYSITSKPPPAARAPLSPPPLFVALEVPGDMRARLRRLGAHLGEEDLESMILLVLRRTCDRLDELNG